MDPRLKNAGLDAIGLIYKYKDVLLPLANAIAVGKIKKSLIVALVKEAMTEASDEQMKAELKGK